VYFINKIIEYLNDASDFFYDLYLECYYAPYIPGVVAYLFYQVCLVFNRLAWRFSDFGSWVDDVAYKLTKFFTELELDAWFKEWKTKILDAWNWVRYAWSNVTSIINDWWSPVTTTVKGWIAVATQGLDTLKVAWDSFWKVTFPQWTSKLDTLKAAWDSFWTVTFPNLVSFQWLTSWWNGKLKEVDSLIDSKIKEASPLFAGWQEVKNSVVEFISNPLDWIETRFTDWFLGKE